MANREAGACTGKAGRQGVLKKKLKWGTGSREQGEVDVRDKPPSHRAA